MRHFINIIESSYFSNDMEGAIHKTVGEFTKNGHTLFDIGNGLCDDFVRAVEHKLTGTDLKFSTVETANFFDIPEGEFEPIGWDWDLLETHWDITTPDNFAEFDAITHEWPHHVWLYHNGLHYDAESPKGVKSFFDLMFFRRWMD